MDKSQWVDDLRAMDSQWTDVKDHLPDIGIRVLVNAMLATNIASWNGKRWVYDNGTAVPARVEWWMPFPAAPKKELDLVSEIYALFDSLGVSYEGSGSHYVQATCPDGTRWFFTVPRRVLSTDR